jgi:AcrR family transcriptional regulator
MPYPPEHRDATRVRIIESAQALFNRRGFTDVSIDQVMARAGLTRGGFYTYFRGKSDLYAEAVEHTLAITPWSRWGGVSIDFAAREAAEQVIEAYLSREHFEDIEGSCPMVTLPSDVARSGPVVRRAFERVFRAMTEVFEAALLREGRPDEGLAMAIAGICVGGMVVSRSVDSPDLAAAIRAAARHTALDLGGWGGSSARRRRGGSRGRHGPQR